MKKTKDEILKQLAEDETMVWGKSAQACTDIDDINRAIKTYKAMRTNHRSWTWKVLCGCATDSGFETVPKKKAIELQDVIGKCSLSILLLRKARMDLEGCGE